MPKVECTLYVSPLCDLCVPCASIASTNKQLWEQVIQTQILALLMCITVYAICPTSQARRLGSSTGLYRHTRADTAAREVNTRKCHTHQWAMA